MEQRIAIIGGGASALYLFKNLTSKPVQSLVITIFDASEKLGAGMPYSERGANMEHITNVSGIEIPPLVTPLTTWLKALPPHVVQQHGLDPLQVDQWKVIPRLLFGRYLESQFDLLKQQADRAGVITTIHLKTTIVDVEDRPKEKKVCLKSASGEELLFDRVIICTGHEWPLTFENKIDDYFDSPYPPKKLDKIFNHPVAIKGSSLTAIDAIKTLAKNNGSFIWKSPNNLSFQVDESNPDFKIVMHSLDGLLPAIRFHLEDPHLSEGDLLSKEQIEDVRKHNDGFLSLDYLFEKGFKNAFIKKDPDFYKLIQDMNVEAFVDAMMSMRQQKDPFEVFRIEYEEAQQSIRHHESIYWKEKLAALSFAINYPAKYLSAEDRQRLQKILMPLISLVIAFVPQESCEELLALYDSGVLQLISVDRDSKVIVDKEGHVIYQYNDEQGQPREVFYKTYIDCSGQRHFSFEEFGFKTLVEQGGVSPALLRFQSDENGKAAKLENEESVVEGKDGHYYLRVPGIAIDDYFRIIGRDGTANPRIFMMAVPYIGGYNPDYSGLDFCEQASRLIVPAIFH